MRKRVVIIKRALSLLLIFLLSINSFAAISDNDGSAFITKAEFDALKSSFQMQIDSYNNNIDSKIDSAIASYLSGISLSKEPTELWTTVRSNTAGKFRWANATLYATTGTGSLVNDVLVTTERYYNHKEVRVYSDFRSHDWPGYADARGGIIYQVGATAGDAKSEYQLMRSYFYGCGTFVSELTAWDSNSAYNWVGYDRFTEYDANNQFSNFEQKSTGSGKLYEMNRLANDKYEIKYYNTKAFLSVTANFSGYTYKDFASKIKGKSSKTSATEGEKYFQSVYTKASGANDDVSFTVDLAKGTGFTVTSKSTKPASNPYNSTSSWYDGNEKLSWTKVNDERDYSFYYWGSRCNQNFYALTDQVVPAWGSATKVSGYSTTDTYHTYPRSYYPVTGTTTEDVKVGRVSYSFYVPQISPEYLNLNNIENQFVSAQVSDVICHGNGAWCFTNKEDDAKIKIKDIKIKLYKADNATATGGTVKLMLSKNKFVNGNYASASDKIYETTFTIPSSGEGTFETAEFEVEDADQTVWMNVYETTTDGYLVDLQSLTPMKSI